MTCADLQHMPVSNAYLCSDCHSIGNCAEYCPACASQSILALGPILNREKKDSNEK